MERLLLIVLLWGATSILSAQLPLANFYHLRQDDRLLSSRYFSIVQDDYGFIWFGSYDGGGLYRYDGYNLRTFVIDPANIDGSITSNNINNLYCPGDNFIYVSAHGRINTVDLVSGLIKVRPADINKIPSSGALYNTGIIKDSAGSLWISSSYGLSNSEISNESFRWLLPPDDSSFESPPPERIREMIPDLLDPDLLWLGTYHGLFSYHISTNRYQFFSRQPKLKIDRLSQDSNGIIWIVAEPSTWIYSFDPNTEKFGSINLSQFLRDGEVVASLSFFDDLNPWITTTDQVGIYNLKENRFDAWRFETSNRNGLLPYGGYHKIIADRHGRIWIGGTFGIQFSKEPLLPVASLTESLSVHIIEIKSNNERANTPKPLIYRAAIPFERDQRDLEISFVLPNPLQPDLVEYQYKMEGYDNTWVSTRNRSVRYPKLPGGSFRFLVKGREGSDDFTAITTLDLSIEKRLMEFLWFWLVLVAFAGSLIGSGFWLRIRAVRKEEKLMAKFQQDLAEVQMQALRSQMNPHFLFNCLNSIKYYAINKTKDETADYLSKFSLLVRTILNNSKSDTVSLNDELDAIRLYIEIENLRLENKFEYQIEIDPTVEIAQVKIPPMVLQPYVENAIWHGLMPLEERGKLILQVKNLGDRMQCIIEDNGIGREAARKLTSKNPKYKKSLGMQITLDRIHLLRKVYGVETKISVVDLILPNGRSGGTRVIVEIPTIDVKD